MSSASHFLSPPSLLCSALFVSLFISLQCKATQVIFFNIILRSIGLSDHYLIVFYLHSYSHIFVHNLKRKQMLYAWIRQVKWLRGSLFSFFISFILPFKLHSTHLYDLSMFISLLKLLFLHLNNDLIWSFWYIIITSRTKIASFHFISTSFLFSQLLLHTYQRRSVHLSDEFSAESRRTWTHL